MDYRPGLALWRGQSENFNKLQFGAVKAEIRSTTSAAQWTSQVYYKDKSPYSVLPEMCQIDSNFIRVTHLLQN